MSLFRKYVESIDDVEAHVRVRTEAEEYEARVTRPYLRVIVPQGRNASFFEVTKTLVGSRHKMREAYIGAVIFRKTLPTLDAPYKIDVALPIAASNSYQGYGATQVDPGLIDSEILQQGSKEDIARSAASYAVYGYLEGSQKVTPFHQPIKEYLRS